MRILFFAALSAALLLGGTDPAFCAGPALKAGDVVVSIRNDLHAYESLEKAKAGGESDLDFWPVSAELFTDGPMTDNHTYRIKTIRDGWAELNETNGDAVDGTPYWISAEALIRVEDFVKDPANKNVTMGCLGAVPARMVVDLDSRHKNATLRWTSEPGLNGGHITLDAWDAAEKNRLWPAWDPSTPGKDGKDEGLCLSCHLAWPVIPHAGDVDGDGRLEILFQNVWRGMWDEPVPFSRVRWTGQAFERLPDISLTVAVDSRGGMPKNGLLNQRPPQGKGFINFERLLEVAPDGRIKGGFARIGVMKGGGFDLLQRGTGWFRIDAAGKKFTFEGWEQPLKDIN